MNKIIVLLSLLPLGLFADQVLIQGRALNGSADSSGIAGVELLLQKMAHGHDAGGAMEEPSRTLSASGGLFRFTVSQPDSTINYFLSADYQGARYFSELITLQPGSSRLITQIVVFDSSNSHAALSTLMHHIFVQDAGEFVSVREMHMLSNPLQKTILNALHDTHEPNATLAFRLPAGSRNVNTLGPDPDELSVHGQTVYFMGILEPGTRQVGYTYEIPWQNDQADLTITAATASRSVDFFLLAAEQVHAINGLTDQGPFTIRDKTFRRYGSQNVQPGQPVQILLQRQSAQSVREHPYYAVAVTAGLLLLAMISVGLKKKQPVKK